MSPRLRPGEARALIGATWEALAEERARAARARRDAEGRIAELEQALAAAREGTAEADSDGVALAAQLKRQRDELRAQVRAGQHALREAETQRDRLATRLRRRERDQARARQVAQELAHERGARRAAQDERDELAALWNESGSTSGPARQSRAVAGQGADPASLPARHCRTARRAPRSASASCAPAPPNDGGEQSQRRAQASAQQRRAELRAAQDRAPGPRSPGARRGRALEKRWPSRAPGSRRWSPSTRDRAARRDGAARRPDDGDAAPGRRRDELSRARREARSASSSRAG